MREVLGPSMALDVALMGMGPDGHTASLFPGSPLVAERKRFVAAAEAPEGLEPRMTLTPRALDAARLKIVLVTGADKAEPARRALEGRTDVKETPARLLRGSTWLLDPPAAAKLARFS